MSFAEEGRASSGRTTYIQCSGMSPEKITAMLIADFMWRRRCIYGRGGFGGQPRLFLVKGLCSGTVARSPIAVNNHRLFSGATYRW